MFFKQYLIFFLFVPFWGCGKKPGQEVIEQKQDLNVQKAEALREFKSEVENIDMSCGEKRCPQSVVLLTTINRSLEKKFCTGLNIGNGRIISTSRCFSEEILNGSDLCDESIFVRSLRSDKVYNCRSVRSVLRSHNSSQFPETWGEDLIEIEVDDSLIDRKIPFSQSSQIIKERTAFWYYESKESEIKSVQLKRNICSFPQKNYFQPLFEGLDLSSSFSITGCSRKEKKESFFYGGVYLKRNKVLGIVYGKPFLLGINLKGGKENYLVQNINCYGLDRSNVFSKDCIKNSRFSDLLQKRESLRNLSLFNERLNKEIQVFKDSINSTDTYLRWHIRKIREGNKIVVLPSVRCFRDSEKWLDNFKTGYFSKYQKKHTYELMLSELNYILEVNSYGEIEPSVAITKVSEKVEVEFSPRELANSSQSNVSLNSNNFGRNKDVGICP